MYKPVIFSTFESNSSSGGGVSQYRLWCGFNWASSNSLPTCRIDMLSMMPCLLSEEEFRSQNQSVGDLDPPLIEDH